MEGEQDRTSLPALQPPYAESLEQVLYVSALYTRLDEIEQTCPCFLLHALYAELLFGKEFLFLLDLPNQLKLCGSSNECTEATWVEKPLSGYRVKLQSWSLLNTWPCWSPKFCGDGNLFHLEVTPGKANTWTSCTNDSADIQCTIKGWVEREHNGRSGVGLCPRLLCNLLPTVTPHITVKQFFSSEILYVKKQCFSQMLMAKGANHHFCYLF